MIEIQHLNKSYGKVKAIQDISLNMEKGQLLSLIGPNGSGKTTLIKCILGLVTPEKGKIMVQGHNINLDVSYREKIGYMPQMGRFPDQIKVVNLFDLLIKLRGVPENSLDLDLFNQFEIKELQHKTLRSLSGGMRQKVSAALAFLFNPSVLVLDEPTSGLDPISSEVLKTKIIQEHKKGKLIIITSHILSDIEDITTHIAYMQDGNLLFYGPFDTLKELSEQNNLSKSIAYLMRTHNYKFINKSTYN